MRLFGSEDGTPWTELLENANVIRKQCHKVAILDHRA